MPKAKSSAECISTIDLLVRTYVCEAWGFVRAALPTKEDLQRLSSTRGWGLAKSHVPWTRDLGFPQPSPPRSLPRSPCTTHLGAQHSIRDPCSGRFGSGCDPLDHESTSSRLAVPRPNHHLQRVAELVPEEELGVEVGGANEIPRLTLSFKTPTKVPQALIFGVASSSTPFVKGSRFSPTVAFSLYLRRHLSRWAPVLGLAPNPLDDLVRRGTVQPPGVHRDPPLRSLHIIPCRAHSISPGPEPGAARWRR